MEDQIEHSSSARSSTSSRSRTPSSSASINVPNGYQPYPPVQPKPSFMTSTEGVHQISAAQFQQQSAAPQAKKKRTSLACDRCSKKKVKCDGEATCENCSKANEECIYSRGPRRRGPRPGASLASFNQRLAQMEQFIGLGQMQTQQQQQPEIMFSTDQSLSRSNTIPQPAKLQPSIPSMSVPVPSSSTESSRDRSRAQSLFVPMTAINEGLSRSQNLRRASSPAPDVLVESPLSVTMAPSLGSAHYNSSSSTVVQGTPLNPSRKHSTHGDVAQISSVSSVNTSTLQYPSDPSLSTLSSMSEVTSHSAANLLHSMTSHVSFESYLSMDAISTQSMQDMLTAQMLGNARIGAPDILSTINSVQTTPADSVAPSSHSLYANQGIAYPLSGSPIAQEAIRNQLNLPLLERFFAYVYPFVAFIPKSHFMPIANRMPPILLDIMYALASDYEHISSSNPSPNGAGKMYFEKAKQDTVNVLSQPTLSSVYALFLVGYYARSHEDLVFASSISAMAIKQGLRMGLDNETSFDYEAYGFPTLTRLQNVEIVRRLWWLLFSSDVNDRRLGDDLYLIQEDRCQTCLPERDSVAFESPEPSSDWIHPGSSDAKLQIAHISSTDVFYTPFNTRNPPALVAQLYKLQRRAFNYGFKTKDFSKEHSEGELEVELKQIEASLDVFSRSLAPEIKTILSVRFLSRDVESDQSFWSQVYVHAMLRFIHFTLFGARFEGYESRGEGFGSSDVRHGRMITDLCNAAAKVTGVIEMFLTHNRQFLFVPPFISAMMAETGMVHLVATKMCDLPLASEEYQRCLGIHIEALREHGRLAKHSLRHHRILARLALTDVGDPKDPNSDMNEIYGRLKTAITTAMIETSSE